MDERLMEEGMLVQLEDEGLAKVISVDPELLPIILVEVLSSSSTMWVAVDELTIADGHPKAIIGDVEKEAGESDESNNSDGDVDGDDNQREKVYEDDESARTAKFFKVNQKARQNAR
jgi:hypothetical protein